LSTHNGGTSPPHRTCSRIRAPSSPWLFSRQLLQPPATTQHSVTHARDYRPAYSFMVLLHLADFQSAQLREFDIYFNGNLLAPSYRPPYLASSTVRSSGWYRAADGNYNITLVATAVSELPPMLNAIETYTLLAFDTPTTFPNDCEFDLHL